jgi:hypothetical protein
VCLARNMLAHTVKQSCPQRTLDRSVNVIRTGRLGTISNKYCSVPEYQLASLDYSGSEFTSKICGKCLKCEVGLCVDKNCFLDYHILHEGAVEKSTANITGVSHY